MRITGDDREIAVLIDDMEAEALLWAEAQEHGPPSASEPPPSSESFDLGAYRVGNVQDNVRDLITWARDAIGVRSQVRIGPKNLRVHARKRAVRDLVPLFTELTGKRPTRRTTKDDHKQYGPIYDFVVAALEPIFREEACTGVEHDIRAALRDPPGQ